jgi:hypothetical protein
MNSSTAPKTEDRARLVGLLAWYLLTTSRTAWPGADGFTVEDVVAADYRTESEAGHVPRLQELIGRHPDLADAIRGFFQ